MISIGGAPVSEMSLTWSWGLSPASATTVSPGAHSFDAGDEVVINLGGMVFTGIVTANPVDAQDGQFTRLTIADRRLMLMWDDVYCLFNKAEVREDNPLTPGIDLQKRFYHILPENWDAQIKTWTEAPLPAGEIIRKLLSAPDVTPWRYQLAPEQRDGIVMDIDASRGAKLGTVLQEISEQQGLLFTVRDGDELVWAAKGSGTVPVRPPYAEQWSDGEALSHNDTRIRIVGDRNRYQDFPVTLEPDWVRAYEVFWAEPAWRAEVNNLFGPFPDGIEGEALLTAKSRSVTVREYALRKGPGYSDPGLWGDVGRNEIPVWIYLNDIVFKAYRVPRSYTVNGIPLHSLQMVEGLLAAVDHDISAGTFAIKTPREYYPDTKAYVIVQGQQLGLLDPRRQEAVTPEQLTSARTLWSANNKFNLDVKNNVVIFQEAVFLPGSGESDLFVFPNVGKVGPGDPLSGMVVPNARVTVAPAAVRAVLVWEAEVYSRNFGSGVRKGPRFVASFSYHALMNFGVFQEEVKYADGKGVDERVETYAAALIAQQAVYQAGGFTRPGACGTELTGAVDRVTVTLDFQSGLKERVDYSKERTQRTPEHERELDRRQRTKELYPGQRKLQSEVDNLRHIARASKELTRPAPAFRDLRQVMETPMGAIDSSPRTVRLLEPTPAGVPVFTGNAGEVAKNGAAFAGINISDGASGSGVSIATQGKVPVRVRGPFTAGDPVGVNDGEEYATSTGAKVIGRVAASYAGTDIVLAPVQLGMAQRVGHPFKLLVTSRATNTQGKVTELKVKVAKDSTILKTEAWNDVATITDFDTELTLQPGHLVWIKAMWDGENGNWQSGTLMSGPEGGTGWDYYPEAYQHGGEDSPHEWIQLLGYLRDVPAGEPCDVEFATGARQKIEQCTTTHLRATWMCSSDEEKQLIRALTPWAGGIVV